MTKIFRPDVSNSHCPILLRDPEDFKKLVGLNFRTLVSEWIPIHFEYYDEGEGCLLPDITYMLPCLAIRAALINKIFPDGGEFEFLPIIVSGEDWMIINSLSSINDIDEAKSILHRDPTGNIFMVQKLVVSCFASKISEIFTVDGSNRSYSYLLQSLVDRIENAGLKGLIFRNIGKVLD